MQEKKTKITWIIFVLFILTGCAGQNPRINARQVEMDNLKRRIQFLQEQNSQLARELQTVKRQVEENTVATNQIKAEYATKIDELTREIETIRNRQKDTSQLMSNMRDKPPGITPSPTFQDESQPQDTSSPGQQSLAVDKERELYNTAYKDLIRGNYQLALQGFLQFVSQYPNSDLTDNSQYWIGEVYYAQGRFQDAIREFDKVVKNYRNADKAPSALLKIGFCYLNIEEEEQAKIYLEEVITKYPDSDEANLARGRLSTLN